MKNIHIPKLLAFVFIVSWIGVVPGLLKAHEVSIPKWVNVLSIFMVLGPLFGAILFIYTSSGKTGLKQFFGRLFRFKTSPAVILIAVALPIVLSFAGSYLGLMIADMLWPADFTILNILQTAVITFLIYLVVNTEELVWRGIVFDQFYNKFGYIKACLLIIPIWGIFHLPLFLFPGGHLAGYGVLDFAFLVIPSTFVLGWIYINSNRSLFYVHIHHQLLNGVGQAFPLFPVFIGGLLAPVRVFCTIYCVVALALIINQIKKNRKS